MNKRQLTDSEKTEVLALQRAGDGMLYCFISGEAIDESLADSYEFDHLTAWASGGVSDLTNVRAVKSLYNRKKGSKTLYDARNNHRLEKLFEEKRNAIKLQDIFLLKDIRPTSLVCRVTAASVTIAEGARSHVFPTLFDPVLEVPYFYARVPVQWLENDDQEGLQPRVIDYRRLVELRNHLQERPQLAPCIARLVGNRLRLFDGQHKFAAQILNDAKEADVKVYVSPAEEVGQRKLFDSLMMTNLDAHSKLKQVPFYTSTLLDRMSVVYKEHWDKFVAETVVEEHTEENFVAFMVRPPIGLSKGDAQYALKALIKTAALDGSDLDSYVAQASKDNQYPITHDLLGKAVFPAVLFLSPSKARFNTESDRRESEARNFKVLARILARETGLSDWIPVAKSTVLTNEQRKARRIWHKGSVLTWTQYLDSVLGVALNLRTKDEKDRKLYRADLTPDEVGRLDASLQRLFRHPMWEDTDPTIDTLLVSAQRQKDLFERKGLTELFVLVGAT